jgi:alkyl hydroperoxide reductase subunit D
VQSIKDYLSANTRSTFKDARMTLEAVLFSKSSLDTALARVCAYAVAVSLKAPALATVLKQELATEKIEQAEVAAAIMGMTSVYYSFLDMADLPGVKQLPAQLRMVSYGQQVQLDKLGFEAAALAVALANKCKPCIAAHVEELKGIGFTDEQFRDIARVAASVNALAKVL